jgi:outer membrane protein assembly factor BamA
MKGVAQTGADEFTAEVGFVALRQNKPAFSGRFNVDGSRSVRGAAERGATRRSATSSTTSQDDVAARSPIVRGFNIPEAC